MSKKKQAGVAKLFIRVNGYYIFSKKRKRSSPKSDHYLELFGGHINDGESPRKALIREIEEELGCIIAAKLKNKRPKPKKIVVDKEDHFIYKVSFDSDDFKNMRCNTCESYGFEKFEARVIDEQDKLRIKLSCFTTKTRNIFRALRLI